MRWTIGKRLFAALTLASVVIVGLNAAATRWSFQQGFSDYLYEQDAERMASATEQLAAGYRAAGSWSFVVGDRRVWGGLFQDDKDRRPPRPGSRERGPPDDRPPPGPPGLRDRVTLVDASGEVVFGPPLLEDEARRFDIDVDGTSVGALWLRQPPGVTEQVDLNFVEAQTRSTLYIAGAVLLVAAAIAALISGQLVRPIRRLAAGTHDLAAGEFDERITVTGDDELGDLARDFNQLAETLRRNQQSRRQWVSDISHELRTPLAILSGELQAIEDGVRQFDDGTRQSLQAEVARLQKLVTDLHELTLSDEGGLRYHHETVSVVSILSDVLEASENRAKDAGISVNLQAPGDAVLVDGDSARLDQLFSNLVENSIRYTDSPGRLEVSVEANENEVSIVFADSAPGVADDQHDRLFDRLFRADASRNRQSGGSGLGLSICAAIVKAHAGHVSAEAAKLGGVAVTVTLPRIPESTS